MRKPKREKPHVRSSVPSEEGKSTPSRKFQGKDVKPAEDDEGKVVTPKYKTESVLNRA
jgi:hypothetical protein